MATMLVLAAESNHLGPVIAVLVFGLVVGVAGHIFKSRTLILTGILVIGLTSAYFAFVLKPGSG